MSRARGLFDVLWDQMLEAPDSLLVEIACDVAWESVGNIPKRNAKGRDIYGRMGLIFKCREAIRTARDVADSSRSSWDAEEVAHVISGMRQVEEKRANEHVFDTFEQLALTSACWAVEAAEYAARTAYRCGRGEHYEVVSCCSHTIVMAARAAADLEASKINRALVTSEESGLDLVWVTKAGTGAEKLDALIAPLIKSIMEATES